MSSVAVKIFGYEAVKRWFERSPAEARAAMEKAMTQSLFVVERAAKLKVSGAVLKVRTGRLRSSIGAPGGEGIKTVTITPAGVVGTIGTKVKYARIHEIGGTIHVPDITPRNKSALRFFVGGKAIFAKRVKAHDVTMPARPYLGPAIDESRDKIDKIFGGVVKKALRDLKSGSKS